MADGKPGPKKSPTIERLEGRIRNLERLIERLKEEKVNGVDLARLSSVGFGVDYDEDKKRYNIRVIKYNPEDLREVQIVETRDGGDAVHRVEFEMKKFIVREINLIRK